ncbi:MAG: oxygen-independent coproporphyrinogen III oxidase [Gammaproteobacteria bacterium]|nr:oxygen-independent coproporphyrinogen III oxidase [Gammaproteobacteria bacterium]
MINVLPFDAELLRRYDRPGPRYTSYPTAPHFTPAFSERELREHAKRSNADPIPRQLSLYLHIPYCVSPCFYCGCNRIITRDFARSGPYIARLLREAEQVAPLFDRDREVIQLHLGGGTPNFLRPHQIAELIEALGRQFHFSRSADRDFSIELDPRMLRAGDIQAYASIGLNRASLGVQDFDETVQRAVNREQSIEQTLAAIEDCRRAGFRSVNIDLIYGLPKQTLAGFAKTLDTVLAARPDRLAIYAYAHMPELFKAQKQIDAADLPDPETKLQLLGLAIEKLSAAGYRYIGMDHFALPEDDLARAQEAGDLHRNFMGYTTHADCDLIGLGVSAISHIGDSFSQNPRDLSAWEQALDAGRLPVWRGIVLDRDDIIRGEVIQQLMCRGEIDIPALEERFDIEFERYFADSVQKLSELAADGLVAIQPTRIVATSRGRLLLRIIAMCFDRYLSRPASSEQRPRYSRVI